MTREDNLDRELRFHIDQYTADLIAQGVDPSEACRRARLELGGIEQSKEECRDARPTRWLSRIYRKTSVTRAPHASSAPRDSQRSR